MKLKKMVIFTICTGILIINSCAPEGNDSSNVFFRDLPIYNPQDPEVPAAVSAASQAVVLIYTGYDTCGTGFLISSDGYILTNNHVVGLDNSIAESDNIEVIFQYEKDGNSTVHDGVNLIFSDPELDVSLIKIDSVSGLEYLSLGSLEDDSVMWVVGHPYGLYKKAIEVSEPSVDGDILSFDSYATFGNSGSPVIDRDSGSVVAILHSLYLDQSTTIDLADTWNNASLFSTILRKYPFLADANESSFESDLSTFLADHHDIVPQSVSDFIDELDALSSTFLTADKAYELYAKLINSGIADIGKDDYLYSIIDNADDLVTVTDEYFINASVRYMSCYDSHAGNIIDLLEARYDLTGNRKYLYPQKVYYDESDLSPSTDFYDNLSSLLVRSTIDDAYFFYYQMDYDFCNGVDIVQDVIYKDLLNDKEILYHDSRIIMLILKMNHDYYMSGNKAVSYTNDIYLHTDSLYMYLLAEYLLDP